MPRNITFTVSKILKSIPDNLIISNNNEREALKDLLLCVKNNEESILKPIKGHLYQDPTLQSLKDKLQNKKNFSHTKYSKAPIKCETISPYDVICNQKFTYIQISSEDEAGKLLNLLNTIRENKQEKDHILKVLCTKLKRIIKFKEYPLPLKVKSKIIENKNIKNIKSERIKKLGSIFEKNSLKYFFGKLKENKLCLFDNLNTQIQLQQTIIETLTERLENMERELKNTKYDIFKKEKIIKLQQTKLDSKSSVIINQSKIITEKNKDIKDKMTLLSQSAIKISLDQKRYTTIIKSLNEQNEKLKQENKKLTSDITKSNIGVIGGNINQQTNSPDSNLKSLFAFGL